MKIITKTVFLAAILFLIFIWVEIVKSPSDDGMNLYFLSVGQGDSELIQKGDYQILIDGGPDSSVLSEIGKIMPLSDRKIEEVVLTHPHADHLAGLNEIMKRYEIGKIYSSGSITTSNQYLDFLNTIKEKNIQLIIPNIGEKETLFDGAELNFLWPGDKYKGSSGDNLNNTSEVVQFCFSSHCAIFLGDQETDEQELMLSDLKLKNINYQSELIKISHHGSSNGTNLNTLDEIKPNIAVIEVGADNQFGHPHAATLDLLKSKSIQVLRTDHDGTIKFTFTKDGIVQK